MYDDIDRQIIRAKCEMDHLFFTRYFFKLRQGIKFRINWHHHLIADTIQSIIDGKVKNVAICVPPGSSKTEEAVINFIARGLAVNPRSRFLHLSGSDSLASLNSATSRDIIRSDEYQSLWPLQIAEDADAKKRWNVMVNGQIAGGVYATSLGGQITGFRAGHMVEGFSGAIICFPYDAMVATESGPMKIGDIVDRRKDTKIYSYNEKTGSVELKKIKKHHENPGSKILRVEFSDGAVIECTPDHKIFTDNRGWVEARLLLITDVLPCFEAHESLVARFKRHSDFLRQLTGSLAARIMRIPKPFWFSNAVMIAFKSGLNAIRGRLPGCTIFNRVNNSFADIKLFRKLFGGQIRGKNHSGVVSGELGADSLFTDKIFTKPNRIINVFAPSTICKIFDSVISLIPIEMSNFHSICLRSYKSLRNGLMNLECFNSAVFCGSEGSISKPSFSFNEHNSNISGSNSSESLSIFNRNKSGQASDSSDVGYLIKAIKTAKRYPLNVSIIGHESRTFCIAVEDNHNFFIQHNHQALLVSNCDDPIKPEDAFSKVRLEAANRRLLTTVKSRKANPDTPILMIMQRLSQHDPVGFIEGGNLGSDWHIVKIPAVLTDEFVSKLDKKYQDMIDSEMRAPDGRFSYWPYKEPIEQLLAMERGDGADQSGTKISRHVFNSQYQQTPIALGGNLIHGHHFKRYTVLPKIKYRKIYADTAMKTKEANDWSVFQCWGLGEDGKLYLLDSIRGKWEAPELQRRAFEFWLKNKVLILGQLRKMMVEDKASGTGLIQTLKLHPYNVQVEGIERDKDKLTRVMDALPYIESGLVCLPEDAPFTNDFLAECESFSADMTHDHDDQIDCLSDACIDMLSSANKINVWSALAEKRPEGKLNAVQKRFIPQIIVR